MKKYRANKNHPFLKEGAQVVIDVDTPHVIIESYPGNCVYRLAKGASPEVETEWYDEERWKPEEDEEYWFVDSEGEVFSHNYEEAWITDAAKYKAGNCYRTKEEAQAARERVLKAYKSV